MDTRSYVSSWRWRDGYTDSSPSFRIHVVLLPDGSFFTVDAKRFCMRMCGSGPKPYELTDGSITTVGVKCFRHAEVLFQPSSQLAESTPHRSRVARNATFTSTMYLYEKLFRCSLLLSASSCSHASRERQRLSSTTVAFVWLVLFTTLRFALYSLTVSAMWLGSSSLRQWHVHCWYAGTMLSRSVPSLQQVSAVRAADHRFPIKSARVEPASRTVD